MKEFIVTFQPDFSLPSIKVLITAVSENEALKIIRAQYPGVRISNFMIREA
jgi:hypothetical protein